MISSNCSLLPDPASPVHPPCYRWRDPSPTRFWPCLYLNSSALYFHSTLYCRRPKLFSMPPWLHPKPPLVLSLLPLLSLTSCSGSFSVPPNTMGLLLPLYLCWSCSTCLIAISPSPTNNSHSSIKAKVDSHVCWEAFLSPPSGSGVTRLSYHRTSTYNIVLWMSGNVTNISVGTTADSSLYWLCLTGGRCSRKWLLDKCKEGSWLWELLGRWMNGWVDGCENDCMDGYGNPWMNGWMDGWVGRWVMVGGWVGWQMD